MTQPEFNIEMIVDGNDNAVGIKPPVDNAFRESIYDILDGMGLIKEIVVRGGNFFETVHSPDGSPFSELRISSTALEVAGKRLVAIAQASQEVLGEQDHTATISPYLKSTRTGHSLFDGKH